MANTVCRQLGFTHGQTYTFGATTSLPTLPIVAGLRTCLGGELDIFQCAEPDYSAIACAAGDEQAPDWLCTVDRDCSGGCVGRDGISGTADDSICDSCTHSIDQGVMCYTEGESAPGINPELGNCRNPGHIGDQPVIFGCIDYHTARSTYDVTNGDHAYTFAMQAFNAGTEITPEPSGYCRGALTSAGKLSNHDVCINGANENIGFHIRVPFVVVTPGARV
jgi:hypothetical protein